MNFLILLVLLSASGVLSQSVKIEEFQRLILDSINETAHNFEPCDENVLQKATFADMIEIKRRGYFHWCVFVTGNTVIQLNNPEFDKLSVGNAFDNFTGQVELRNLIELAREDFCRINNKLMQEELKHNVTSYNVLTYNCEHFAAKLKFGVPFSSQIEAAKRIVAREDLKETVAEMFEIAASLDSTSSSTSESLPDNLFLLV